MNNARALLPLFALLVQGPAIALAQGGATPAAPGAGTPAVAEKELDVDGDGTLDLVRIEHPAAVAITIARPGNAPPVVEWKPFASAQGAVVAGQVVMGDGPRFGNQRVLLATALFRGDKRRGPVQGARARTGLAMVLAWKNGALVKLWEGTVGAQGSDNEYQVRVDASALGLLRYQERSDIQRCDGQPAYLFPERFDFKERRFRPVSSPLGMPENALVLTASQQIPDGMSKSPGIAFRTRSASAQSYAEHAGDLVPPRELDDDDLATAWQEGTGGAGHGVFITLASPMKDPEIAALRIVPGDASSKDAFARANRLRRIGVLVEQKHAFWIEFPGDPVRAAFDAPYWVTMPDGVRGDCVTVVLDSVYPGRTARNAKSGDTAIAELAVLAAVDVDGAGPDPELVARIVAGDDAGDAAARVLLRRGAGAVSTIVAELDKGELDAAAALRLRRVLARIGDPGGADALVEGLTASELSTGDGEMLAAALMRLGEPAVAPLTGLMLDELAAASARARAAEILAGMAVTSARDSLISAAGRGDRTLRKAVAVGLGQRSPEDHDDLLDALERASRAPARGAEADLWRAIGLMARRAEPTVRARVAQALAERLATTSDYELSYRLLDAAGALDEEAALTAFEATLARIQEKRDAKSDALRRVSASALTENPNAIARRILVALAGDRDPGTRGLAIAALGPRQDADRTSDDAIIARIEGEPWTKVRRRAVSALGHRCHVSLEARAALDTAVDRDRHIDVQREALGSLVECRAEGIGARLLAIAGDGKREQELRQRAISLIPALADPSLSRELIALFSRLRSRAWSDAASVRLAAAAAVAMGRLGTDDVVAPLMSAAREGSFPEIQAAAATGLGEICPPQALPLMASLMGSSERRVVVAASSAYNQCQR